MVRILIADDHDVVRSGLRSIIEMNGQWQVAGEAADGKAAVKKALETKPDIVILDYALPLLNGVEVARQVRAKLPNTEILMFTMHDSDEIIGQSLAAGARAYVLKSDAKQYLVAAIEALAKRKPFFTGHLSEKLLESYLNKGEKAPASVLSPRERVVVQLIAEGHSNKEIAEILNLSIKTIESQRGSAMKKLNLATTAALVRYAVRNKLVEP